jgi:hypothetical protein
MVTKRDGRARNYANGHHAGFRKKAHLANRPGKNGPNGEGQPLEWLGVPRHDFVQPIRVELKNPRA